MLFSDWSSDVCSSDLGGRLDELVGQRLLRDTTQFFRIHDALLQCTHQFDLATLAIALAARGGSARHYHAFVEDGAAVEQRSEEHTSELQSLMRISYAVFCLKKKKLQERAHTETQVTKNYIKQQ